MYYKLKNTNQTLITKEPLWREVLGSHKEMNENGEEIEIADTYSEEELQYQEQYELLTEAQFHALKDEDVVVDEKVIEMAEIKQWLNEHDYIINKHLLGEYTDNDERWLNYLQERKIKLDRYNELEK